MRRRRVIGQAAALLGAPLVGRAQGLPVVGFLSSRSPRESAPHAAAFRDGLAQLGYAEGRDIVIEYRWAEGRYDRLPALAAELVARRVVLIAAVGGAQSALAQHATRTIPIVFVIGDDPVAMGLAQTFGRPGMNASGLTFLTGELGGKRLALLCELVTGASTVGLLLNPGAPAAEAHRQDVQAAARNLGRQLVVVHASDHDPIEAAFDALVRARAGALVVQNDPFFDSQRARLITVAAQHAVPAVYHIREFPAAGGLMSYGASLVETYRQAGVYGGRVLKGERVGELPIMRPVKVELVINVATAKGLSLAVPQTLLLRADEVMS
jgi:putative tryptophan/tyrosine transport system substrate-binding protein